MCCPHASSWRLGNRFPRIALAPQRFPATPIPARIFSSNPHQCAAPLLPEYGWPNAELSPTEKSKIVCCWRYLLILSAGKILGLGDTCLGLHNARREPQKARPPLPFPNALWPNTRRFVPPPEAPDNGGASNNTPIADAPPSPLAQPPSSPAPTCWKLASKLSCGATLAANRMPALGLLYPSLNGGRPIQPRSSILSKKLRAAKSLARPLPSRQSQSTHNSPASLRRLQ